ncbi:MAG: HD domain-containing phosphohydrolase [Actinomycetota bacterium]
MKQAILDKIIMFGTFVVYLALFGIWLRVAPDPGWGNIQLFFLIVPVLTTVVLFGLFWAFLLWFLMSLIYLPVIWPALTAGKISFLEQAMTIALLTVLIFGAQIFKRYEVKKRAVVSKLADDLAEKVEEQQAVMKAQQSLGTNLDLSYQLKEFLHWAATLVSAREGYITLYDRDSGKTELAAAQRDSENEPLPEPVEELLSPGKNPTPETHMRRFLQKMNAPSSNVCVPLKVKDRLIGALCLTHPTRRSLFTENDISLVSMLGERAAAAIENARLHQLNTELFVDSMRALARIINARDPLTRDHSDKVAKWARLLAEKMGLNNDEVGRISLAAELHDIGMIVVPDSILLKPGRLTEKEFEIVRAHPTTGYEMLKGIKAISDILPAILYHHERIDGGGYPERKKGSDIPHIARIIAVADVYDAITSPRVYRSLPREEADKMLREMAGTQLDPMLVELFLNV